MTTIIPQSQQGGIVNGYATVVASTIVPLPLGASTVVVQATMASADMAAFGNLVGVGIAWTRDGANVSHAASCTWQSGYAAQPGGGFGKLPPGLKMRIPPGVVGFAGQLELPTSVDIGLTMDIRDVNGNSLGLNLPSGSGATITLPAYPELHV